MLSWKLLKLHGQGMVVEATKHEQSLKHAAQAAHKKTAPGVLALSTPDPWGDADYTPVEGIHYDGLSITEELAAALPSLERRRRRRTKGQLLPQPPNLKGTPVSIVST